MARKKIREYDSKRLLKAHILRLKALKLPLNVAQVMAPLVQYSSWHFRWGPSTCLIRPQCTPLFADSWQYEVISLMFVKTSILYACRLLANSGLTSQASRPVFIFNPPYITCARVDCNIRHPIHQMLSVLSRMFG